MSAEPYTREQIVRLVVEKRYAAPNDAPYVTVLVEDIEAALAAGGSK